MGSEAVGCRLEGKRDERGAVIGLERQRVVGGQVAEDVSGVENSAHVLCHCDDWCRCQDALSAAE